MFWEVSFAIKRDLGFSLFSNYDHPGEPVDLMKELEIKLTIFDKVVSKDDYEESCCYIEVEGYVHQDNQYRSNLQFRS